jgi:hypothetical protein
MAVRDINGACLPASAQLFEITLPTFSTFVANDGNYTPVGPAIDGKIFRANLSHGLLYFSFTVYAGQAALDYLQQMNRLEVMAAILGD